MTEPADLTFQLPAWDEKNGIAYHQREPKADAVSYARADAKRDGHIGPGTTGKAGGTASAPRSLDVGDLHPRPTSTAQDGEPDA